jgi:hypothetical protein
MPHFYWTRFSLRTKNLCTVCFFKGRIDWGFIHRSCHKDDDDNNDDDGAGGGGGDDDNDDK